jgi:putative NADH-flavin reductase
MKITIFGASGATGQELVAQALAAHHEVTAFVRTASSLLLAHANLQISVGNFDQPSALESAVQNADAVISVLDIRKKGLTDVCTDGTRSILAAMAAQQKRRLIVLSAYGSGQTHSTSLSAKMYE